MLTRREFNRIKKVAEAERGLHRDMGIISLGLPSDKPCVHFNEQAFRYRFKHFKTESYGAHHYKLSVNMNGYEIFALVSKESIND